VTTSTQPRVVLPDAAAVADLTRFVRRAIRLDPGGSIRLSGHGAVLAIYCCALAGGGGPTVLALRTLALAEPGQVDVTLDLEVLRDRLARLRAQTGPRIALDLTPGSGAGGAWAGLLPPRSGWSVEGLLETHLLKEVAAQGIAEVAAGAPSGAGSAAVTRLRAAVWSRDLTPGSAVPAGAAFAAEGFGFLPEVPADQQAHDDTVSLHRAGPWWRLSLVRGHVLARRNPLG
jgi:hypothetical protein